MSQAGHVLFQDVSVHESKLIFTLFIGKEHSGVTKIIN